MFIFDRFFWHIGIADVDRSIPYDATTIHGTRDLHSIKTKDFQNVFSFDSRKLTCFCQICSEDTETIDLCENINDNYVKPWKHNEINQKGKLPLASFEELESEDVAISIDGDRISDLVREGKFMYMCTCIYMKVIFDNEDEFDKFNVLIYVHEMYLLWLHR